MRRRLWNEHPSPFAADLAVLLVSGVLALWWDWSGIDLVVMRVLGTPQGFPWRDAFLTSRVLHEGGRLLGWAVALGWLLYALKPQWPGPPRPQRVLWLAVALASLLVVPALKHRSHTSCPWDLAEFGGTVPYVPHWLLGLRDGGPGHCFPSGHAVSAFAFLGTALMWRPHRPALAKGLLVAIVLMGLLYGGVQFIRGAHFLSHTLWTAWLCALVAVAARRASPARRRKAHLTPQPLAAAVARSAPGDARRTG